MSCFSIDEFQLMNFIPHQFHPRSIPRRNHFHPTPCVRVMDEHAAWRSLRRFAPLHSSDKAVKGSPVLALIHASLSPW
jgi:hypothetical protein